MRTEEDIIIATLSGTPVFCIGREDTIYYPSFNAGARYIFKLDRCYIFVYPDGNNLYRMNTANRISGVISDTLYGKNAEEIDLYITHIENTQ